MLLCEFAKLLINKAKLGCSNLHKFSKECLLETKNIFHSVEPIFVVNIIPRTGIYLFFILIYLFKTVHFSFNYRLAKYNQLLRIEEELGANAKYAGENFRRPL